MVVAYERRTEDRRERHWWQTGRIRCCSIIDSEQSAIAGTADRLFTAVQVVAGGMGCERDTLPASLMPWRPGGLPSRKFGLDGRAGSHVSGESFAMGKVVARDNERVKD